VLSSITLEGWLSKENASYSCNGSGTNVRAERYSLLAPLKYYKIPDTIPGPQQPFNVVGTGTSLN